MIWTRALGLFVWRPLFQSFVLLSSLSSRLASEVYFCMLQRKHSRTKVPNENTSGKNKPRTKHRKPVTSGSEWVPYSLVQCIVVPTTSMKYVSQTFFRFAFLHSSHHISIRVFSRWWKKCVINSSTVPCCVLMSLVPLMSQSLVFPRGNRYVQFVDWIKKQVSCLLATASLIVLPFWSTCFWGRKCGSNFCHICFTTSTGTYIHFSSSAGEILQPICGGGFRHSSFSGEWCYEHHRHRMGQQ